VFCLKHDFAISEDSESVSERDRVTRFSTSAFFHQTIPSGPLIHGLKPFPIWHRIREVIRQSPWHSGANDTAVAISYADFVQKHKSTVVSITPLSQYDTDVPGDIEIERLWLPLKGISIKKIT
jgi:hypothetical protein